MKTTHTPGPWTATEHSWSRTGIYAANEAIASLDIYDEATEDNQEELEAKMAANAKLIVAAPELYEALDTIYSSTAVLNHLDVELQIWIGSILGRVRGDESS